MRGDGERVRDAAYLVGRGADAEDEPRREVGPGDRLRERRLHKHGGQEEEDDTAADRLPHRVQSKRAPPASTYGSRLSTL